MFRCYDNFWPGWWVLDGWFIEVFYLVAGVGSGFDVWWWVRGCVIGYHSGWVGGWEIVGSRVAGF